MTKKSEEAMKKFLEIVARWCARKMTGQLTLIVNINQGGITSCKFRTEGEEGWYE